MMSHSLSFWGSSFPRFHFLNWYSLHAKPYCALPCSSLPLLTLLVPGLGAQLVGGYVFAALGPHSSRPCPYCFSQRALPDLLATVTISLVITVVLAAHSLCQASPALFAS